MQWWPWKPFYGGVRFDGHRIEGFTAKPAFRSTSGAFAFHVDGEEFVENTTAPHVYVTGQVELHDRDNLSRALGMHSLGCTSDEELIQSSYLRWGTNFPERIVGSFSLVIWDERENLFFACRDHLGTLPFFYLTQATSLHFAGDMRTLLRRIAFARELNAKSVVVHAHVGELQPVEGETYHLGVKSLAPGSFLLATRRGVTMRRYWRPSIRPELVPEREADIYHAARHLVETSVANKIGRKKNIGILLSGGLDSSTLAVVAARHLKQRNLPLTAFAAVNDPANASVPDERPWLEEMGRVENVDLHYIDRAGAGPFDGIEDPSAFETTCHVGMPYFYGPLYKEAEARGTELLFSGNFGELTISGSPRPFLLDLVNQFRWKDLARELDCLTARTKLSRFRYLASELRHLLVPERRKASPFFLRPEFANISGLRKIQADPLAFDSRVHTLRHVADYLERDAMRSTLPPEYLFGISRPYCDKNLLEFCLAVPAHFKTRNGYRRNLIRKAFEDLLPPGILWRRTKLWATPDYYERFTSQMAKGLEFVRSIRSSDPVRDVVDVPRLEAAIRQPGPELLNSSPRKIDFDLLLTVPTSIQLICFLRQFPAFRV